MITAQKVGAEPSDKVLDLVDFLDPGPWVESALCRQVDPEVFFPEKGERNTVARTICGRCEVRVECIEYADRVERDLSYHELHGIVAGLTRKERVERRALYESGY